MLLVLKKFFNNISKPLIVLYSLVFVYCVVNPPIYSPDTYSYLRAMPYRQLGYVIFLKGFTSVFGSYFDVAVVVFHSLFSLCAVHYFLRKTVAFFNLNLFSKIVLLIILLFPFFPPLSIANNICSEGLSYGLYLLFVAVGIDIIFNDKTNYLKYYALLYLVLVFIRGQFIITTLVFGGVYVLLYIKHIFKSKHLINLCIFFGVLFLATFGERAYHYYKDGFFKSTPLGYVSIATAPFYISEETDVSLIDNTKEQALFSDIYNTLVRKDLLIKPEFSQKEAYLFFHENLPKICNQTIQERGVAYYKSHIDNKGFTEQQRLSYPFFAIDASSKHFSKVLISKHFNKWLKLYFSNISYGFYSSIILILIILLFLFSLLKTITSKKKNYVILFLLLSLTLSNAMLIAFAGHSIMRYLFYNYALLFLVLVTLYNIIFREQKS